MDTSKKGTILIVEDEPVFRLIYRGVFEHDGYTVLEAQDGEVGWQMAVEKKPDLVLLDLILPKTSGYEVLQRIRKDESIQKIPVVIFSIMGAEKDIQKALNLGANYYRVKGSNSPRDILVEINSIFEKMKGGKTGA
jgi:two-component system alkaline phosphatase synthesis response regulator PhoP